MQGLGLVLGGLRVWGQRVCSLRCRCRVWGWVYLLSSDSFFFSLLGVWGLGDSSSRLKVHLGA